MGKGGNVKSVNILCPSSFKIEEKNVKVNPVGYLKKTCLYKPFLGQRQTRYTNKSICIDFPPFGDA